MWLDDARGNLVDWTTQRWVQVTGRKVTLAGCPWLEGPVGPPTGIGTAFFDRYAAQHGLRMVRGVDGGLVPDFEVLRSPSFDPNRVSPAITEFYARTGDYALDVWSQWSTPFRPFGRALAALFSRRLQQLNVPLSGLDTSRGMRSEVVPVVDPVANRPVFTAWVRELVGTGHVIYAGAYSTCPVADGTPCVRVVFPLPNGNAIVLMRPEHRPDGSLLLTSGGAAFGGAGFYFTVHARDGRVWARYLRTFTETIHVYPANGELRTDHVLSLWGRTFLRLHYRMRRG